MYVNMSSIRMTGARRINVCVRGGCRCRCQRPTYKVSGYGSFSLDGNDRILYRLNYGRDGSYVAMAIGCILRYVVVL